MKTFIASRIKDCNLPIGLNRTPFPSENKSDFWSIFYERQWRYCVPVFDGRLVDKHFHHSRVLPVVSKEQIAQGATATTFKIQIHHMYDRFEKISWSQNANIASTYALKSFVGRDSQYYFSELETYQILPQSGDPSLIHYYGSYRQDDTYNIVLELADRGSLEQYLSYCQPPASGADILQFWGGLFKIVHGLVCIHNVGHHSLRHGVHQNIKPATILVKDNGLGSQYGWEFKLGGLGFCQFSYDGNFPIHTKFGTRTYGSPECYLKRPGSSVSFNQNIDIWSLGCVFSEVAVWIASGYHGVQNYRNLRTTEAAHQLSDSFHNGKSALGAVRTTHLRLTSGLLGSDTVTAAVICLVEGHMMVPSDRRMTAYQVWEECQGILSQAEAVLERRKDKAPQAKPLLNLDRERDFDRTKQKSGIDISPDTLPNKQDQRSTHDVQASSRIHQPNKDGGKFSSPLQQSLQSSHHFHRDGRPEDLDEKEDFLSRRPKRYMGEAPYLSVQQASGWKDQAKSLGRNSLGRRVRAEPPPGSSLQGLPHDYLRKELQERKHVFLIDNTKTMRPYWQELTTLVGLLAYILKSEDYIEMFNNSIPPLKSRKSTTLVASLMNCGFTPISNIANRLRNIFDGYVAELQRNPSVKPMNLYVLTDGMWGPGFDVTVPIRELRQELRNRSLPADIVAIQFIKFGHAGPQLNDIKDWDTIDSEFVKLEYSNGNIWKMLLGATDLFFDTSKIEETIPLRPLMPFEFREQLLEERLKLAPVRTLPPSPVPGVGTDNVQNIHDPLSSHGTDSPSTVLDPTNELVPFFRNSNVDSGPFHDSGYEGSTERQRSVIARSLPESSFIGVLSSPGTEGETKNVGSVKPSEQEVTLPETTMLRDQEYDIRSIISDDIDIQSKRSSKATYQERIAEENLGYLLARNPQLRPLSEEALRRVGKIRFVDNLRRLLKRYYIELRPIATTKLEVATVNLLRSRYSRARLSQQMSDILAPEHDEADEQQVQQAAITRQELENWIVRNPEFVPQEELDDFDLDIDESSSDDEEPVQVAKIPVAEVHAEIEEPNLPNLTQMESFLLTCGGGSPFQTLSTHLRIFLLPPTLGPLVRILMSLPAERVWLDDQDDTSFSNKSKAFIEDVTEENWNWWPLRSRMRPLGKDQMRLNWICHCNTHLWTELPKLTAEKLQALVQGKPPNTQSLHLCAKRSRYSVSMYAKIMQAAGVAQSSTGTNSNHSSSNAATATTGIQLSQLGPPGPSRPVASPPAAGPSVSGGQGVQLNINTGTISDLFVLFGIRGSRRTLDLAQIDVSKNKEDRIFFQDLRREYRQQRGFWRYWFSVWKLRHCDFVKFEKIRANRIISNEKPDLPVNHLYVYKPKPPNADIPPIDPHEFELSLSPCNSFCMFKPFHDCIEPPDGGLALERIPKRKEALELKVGTREQAWGLLTQYSISALLLLVYLIMCFTPFVGFWAWWQVRHPDDLQNASTPLMVFATLLCVWFASLVYLKGQ
ncbi:hypothetical protein ONS96_002294 [Cadophora gregata f. sp. sojae]|nr:hypothetical protein ONS96_002294 [Cadophora gregata f. sp. sojae]